MVGPSLLPVITLTGMSADELFLNRDLSWLEFNSRVLHEAEDSRTPLLERVRFLGIVTSNLDEFFMKRVGGLQRQGAAGLDPSSLLSAIRQAVLPQVARQSAVFLDSIVPELAAQGIRLLRWEQLSPKQIEYVNEYFRTNVFPVLTPIAVDPGHPFPLVSNLSTSLGLLLHNQAGEDEPLFARVKIPGVLPQWIAVERSPGDREVAFLSLRELIERNLESLFPGMEVVDVMPFRVTRNSDVERDEEDAEDLLEMVAEELRERRFAKVVRLEHGPNPNPQILQFVMNELELREEDVYEVAAELDYTTLKAIADLNRPSLKFDPWVPTTPPAISDTEQNIFGLIRAGDILVHHPYESFTTSVEHFIGSAAVDPRVRAIKMTLYRTGDGSPFIPMLIRAAESGKQVVCLVELKARFDEERNIAVARMLEKSGVHVVYGVVGFKTHCKLAMVVREEPGGIRSYLHVGTGNYHSKTAQLYTDLGLFTAQPEIVEDAMNLFNYLTGRSRHRNYKRLLVAPINMKETFLAKIHREREHAKTQRPARIIAKMNSLEDRDICQALYAASSAGVSIDLIVRGFCVLRPGVSGLSENIRVISVIGRFLEHSRLYYFANGAAAPVDGEFFFGSADWMYRNLESRVEAVTPILAKPLRERCWEILSILLNDRRQAWEMQPDGTYVQRTVVDPTKDIGTHAQLMALTRQRAGGITKRVTGVSV
jgi:polyphosphate kinase